MDWAFMPSVASLLADRGFTVVRFNFSGTGMEPGDEVVTDLSAFRDNTHSQELAELIAVLEALGRAVAPGDIDTTRIGLFGHSRGGGAAVLAASQPGWRDRIRAVVTWAAVSTFDRYSDEQKREWRSRGELPVVNTRTGQALTLGLPLLNDIEEHPDRLDVVRAASSGRSPWLIVHGDEDETVSPVEARKLAAAAQTSGRAHELLTLPGAQHTFGARHPFAGPTRHLIAALNSTQAWLMRHV
jgi:dipeptidyl aminopeptidase/acylaminoacyl peptidase